MGITNVLDKLISYVAVSNCIKLDDVFMRYSKKSWLIESFKFSEA